LLFSFPNRPTATISTLSLHDALPIYEGTGLTRSQPTTSNGDFTFSDLPVGLYTVTVSNPGFQSYKHEKVEVAVGRVTNLPITLRSEEHTSELQSPDHLVCRLLLEKKT